MLCLLFQIEKRAVSIGMNCVNLLCLALIGLMAVWVAAESETRSEMGAEQKVHSIDVEDDPENASGGLTRVARHKKKGFRHKGGFVAAIPVIPIAVPVAVPVYGGSYHHYEHSYSHSHHGGKFFK